MATIGIFGGTFNPIHIGHLICAQYIYENRNLDKIFFVPCAKSPHKLDNNETNSNHRLEMVKIAIEHFEYFEYSDFEITKGGISYTIDTIKHYLKIYDNIELIIGYDNLLDFKSWKNYEQIFNLSKIIVVNRNSDLSKSSKKFSESIVYLKSPNIEVSSTEIRERVKNNLSIDLLVTKKVKKYIIDNNLYR